MQDLVNTEDTTIRNSTNSNSGESGSSGHKSLHTIVMQKKYPGESWGFRLHGGKDRGLALQIVNVPLSSIAGYAGCQSNDYLVKIGQQDVFNLTHEQARNLIKNAGDRLSLVVERGDHIVPSMNEAFPTYAKKKVEPVMQPVSNANKPYYQRVLEESGALPGQKNKGFTTVGKPKMTTKQFNSPLEIYGEEALDEIMEQGTLFGREVDTLNPWNLTNKQLDLNKSDVLSQIMANAKQPQTATIQKPAMVHTK